MSEVPTISSNFNKEEEKSQRRIKNQSLPDINVNSITMKTNHININLFNESKVKSPRKRSTVISQNNTVNTQFYCPCCTHCNSIDDEKLDQHLFAVRESKSILSKALEYIINNNFMEKNNLDLFNVGSLSDERQIQQLGRETNINTEGNQINIHNNNGNNEDKFEIDHLLQHFTKQLNVNNRLTYQVVSHFMNALIEDKYSLNSLASAETILKMNKSLLTKGLAFDQNKENQVFFDEELENLFDPKTKEVIKTLFRSNYLNNRTN
jgi:hypothetical protein